MATSIKLIQEMTWPGAVAIESCIYTASHGEQPGFGQFTLRQEPGLMAGFGDLTLNDGYNPPIVLKDCKIQDVRYQRDHDGDRWYCRFIDRRWRWDFNAISGVYNDLDLHGKLVPWRIASPTELMLYCLRKMEERNYDLDLPPGIDSKQYANAKDYFTVGINTLPTGTNPKVVWQDVPPAAAASRLAVEFGRRFVMDPFTNKIIVARPGVGADLPADFLETYGANATQPATPAAVGVIGSPILYQARFLLVPVCKEWHGQYVPPDQVSWRPMDVNTLRRVTIQFKTGVNAPVGFTAGALVKIGRQEYSIYGSSDPGALVSALKSQITADASASVTAVAQGSSLVLLGTTPGDLDVTVRPTWFQTELTNETLSSGPTWKKCLAPSYMTVRPTSRLSYSEAKQLAAESLWRTYRLADWGLQGTGTPIFIPGYGPIVRRQDILLQPSAVEQVTPQPYDLRQFKGNDPLTYGVTWDFYNGYSRNRSAAIYGSIAKKCNSNFWRDRNYNTPDGERVNVPFSIDPVNQLVIFQQPIYKQVADTADNPFNGGWDFPSLVLETGCQLADPNTGELIRSRRWFNINLGKIQKNEKPAINPINVAAVKAAAKFNAGMPSAVDQPPRDTEWYTHEDVWSEIIGVYDWTPGGGGQHVLTTTKYVDEQESTDRAYYYISMHLNEHIVQGGATATYRGLRSISLDGAIQQVTLEIGKGGAKTTASRRMEHSPYYPPYPVRRRKENLDADKQAAIINENSKYGIYNNLSIFKKALGPIGNFIWKS